MLVLADICEKREDIKQGFVIFPEELASRRIV